MNVLHAAVINNNIGIVKHMMRYPALAQEADRFGRIPLHYAAYLGNLEMVEAFISCNGSLAYHKDKEGMSPIHLAAKNIQVSVIELLFREHPHTSPLYDRRRRNVLHTSVETGESALVKLLLSSDISITFVNERDEDGNTPLHLAAELGHVEILILFADDPKVDKTSSNNKGLTTYDIIRSSDKLSPEDKEALDAKCDVRGLTQVIPLQPDALLSEEDVKSARNKFGDFNLLVATVTFAAGFTMPGGYIQSGQDEQGMAVLAKRTDFQVFVIADAVAFWFIKCLYEPRLLLFGIQKTS